MIVRKKKKEYSQEGKKEPPPLPENRKKKGGFHQTPGKGKEVTRGKKERCGLLNQREKGKKKFTLHRLPSGKGKKKS